jgi:Protein of unknown function (DUF1059)
MPRKYIDFRYFDESCTLAISGTEEELLDLAVLHASTVHGYPNTLELRQKIRSMLKDEAEVKVAGA